MRILLGTVPTLWLASGGAELSARARDAILDPDNSVFLSAVSAWEVAVKYDLGRLRLAQRPETLIPAIREAYAIESLPVDEAATLYVHRLPRVHRDPFDRMLVCQAIVHGLTLATPDEAIQRYPVPTIW